MRTRLASERTLMAWVRTAVSLIGFGFSIPELFARIGTKTARSGGLSPRALGVFLIALGTLGLVAGVVQHLQLIERVAPERRRDSLSAATVTAVVMALVGTVAMLHVLSR